MVLQKFYIFNMFARPSRLEVSVVYLCESKSCDVMNLEHEKEVCYKMTSCIIYKILFPLMVLAAVLYLQCPLIIIFTLMLGVLYQIYLFSF